ncbi:hypothetical protein [Rickettsiella endosymbiont of Rhagonycha lignosa]|uniref:hypothetical protein n=1 Tax=Rickettsiella endosymbiont of Rhagonycha lignosa TaxID=3077937 RepID=UPI00313EB55D
MPTIYLATPKNSFIPEDELKEKNFNYIVIKKHNYKLKKIIKSQGSISIDLMDNYASSDKYLLSFKVEESQGKNLQKYLDSKQKDFLEENNLINEDSIEHFFKFIQAEQDYDFKRLDENENLEEQIISNATPESPQYPRTSDIVHNLLDKEHEDLLNNIPTQTLNFNRQTSVYSEDSKSIDESFNRRVSMHDDPLGENAVENAKTTLFAEKKINSFFIKINSSEHFKNIKCHGEKIENGSFNGKEKSEILLSITELAAQIRKNSNDKDNISSTDQLKTLKQNISKLDAIINNTQNLKILERYRGFSPFKCLATLWGGGKVKSKEYVEQLRNELNPLINEVNEVLSVRPTA